MKTPCSIFWQVYRQPTGLQTSLYSRNLNYRDNATTTTTTTPNIGAKDYILRAVWGTKVNVVTVFYYEFPTWVDAEDGKDERHCKIFLSWCCSVRSYDCCCYQLFWQ